MKCWSSVGSDVVFRTCRTNQLDQNKKQIQESVSGARLNSHYHKNFKFISLVRRIWRSTLVPETISRRCIQTFRTCWTTQFHLGELNWSRHQLFMTLTVLVWFVSWKLRRLAKATGHLRTKPDVFETTYFFLQESAFLPHEKSWIRFPKPLCFETALQSGLYPVHTNLINTYAVLKISGFVWTWPFSVIA